MDLFDSCFGSYSTAAEVLSDFPQGPGPQRERAIVAAAKRGDIPYFNREWMKVPIVGGGMSGAIFVTPDYFSVGTDEDFVRMPMSPRTAEQIGGLIGGRLPTRKMVNDIQRAAPQRLSAQPWGPPYDASMMSTDRYVAHNNKIEQRFSSQLFSHGILTSGHKKDVVVSPNMDREHVCIYGWFQQKTADSAIQGPRPNCSAHSVDYADYSHGIRFVKDTMLVGGKRIAVEKALRDPVMHRLISDEGAFRDATTYTERQSSPPVPPNSAGLITAAIFFAAGLFGAEAIWG